MTTLKAINALPILLRAFRPIFRVMAWALFILLVLFWAIEAVYSARSYAAAGWPAVIGYLQGISQGHYGTPVSWSVAVAMHIAVLVITLLLGLYLLNSRWRIGTERGLGESRAGKQSKPR